MQFEHTTTANDKISVGNRVGLEHLIRADLYSRFSSGLEG